MLNQQAIDRFIEDFDLKQPAGIIGFAAKIKFHLNGHTKTRYTEVQIVMSNNLYAIYLINPDLPFEDLPDSFALKDCTFEYIAKDRVEIFFKNNEKDYVEMIPVVPGD